MNQISNEALEFLTEAKEQLSKNPDMFTYRDKAANFIALRTGMFDDCIMIYELGNEVGNFTEQLPRQNKVLIDYDERENYKKQNKQLNMFKGMSVLELAQHLEHALTNDLILEDTNVFDFVTKYLAY